MAKANRTPEEKVNIELMAKGEEQQNLGIAQPTPPATPASVLPNKDPRDERIKELESKVLDLELGIELNKNEIRTYVELVRTYAFMQENYTEAIELLKECNDGLNWLVRKPLQSGKFKDTYELASAISKFLKYK